jgi:hypothetical protein
MNFRTVCIVGVLSAGPFGLAFLLLPEQVAAFYGVTGFTESTVLVGRLYGIGLLYTTGAAFAAKDTADAQVQRLLGASNALWSLIGGALCLQSVLAGRSNAMMWSVVALFWVVAVLWWLARPKARA